MSQPMVQPYLFFGGNCEEALEFYREHLGAEVQMLLRFSENPEPMPPEMLADGFEDKVMHATFTVAEKITTSSPNHPRIATGMRTIPP